MQKRDSNVRGHFLKDYEDKTPTVSPQEKVAELEVQKPSKQIEAPQKGVLKNIYVDISFKMDEEVKTPIKEQALENSKNSIEGVELPKPLFLLASDKMKASFYSLPKEKKILLVGGGAIITLFLIDKLLEKNSGYKARKEKVGKKVRNLFKQFIDNLPRI